MSLNKYVILVNILTEITNVVCVLAESVPVVTVAATATVSEDMGSIAEDICRDLQFFSEDTDLDADSFTRKCNENFLKKAVLPTSPPEIQWDRLEDGVSFTLSQTNEAWRLVVQVPDDDEFTDIINYSLMDKDKSDGMIPTVPGATYTIWTTTLNGRGEHSHWRRGPQIKPWKLTKDNVETMSQSKVISPTKAPNEQNVFVPPTKGQKEQRIIVSTRIPTKQSVTIPIIPKELVTTSPKSPKEQVVNETKTSKDQSETKIIAPNVPKLKDKEKSVTKISAKAPAPSVNSLKVNLEGKEPQNVTLMATEAGDGWDVYVGWVPPKRTPDAYNVTVVGRHVRRSVKVPGNKSQAVIRNVKDEGFYYVIIDTVVGKNVTRTSRNAIFPEKTNLTGLVVSVAVLAVVICLVGGFLYMRSRRAAKQKRSYFVDLDEKPSKDAMEAFDVESSRTEEYWEVGSRRLLLHEVVGEGAFGVVKRGTLAGEEVAVKMLKDFPTQDEIRSFHAEIELMRLIKTVGRHAHVLNLVECSAGRRPLILTEYCSGGDLLSYLRRIWDVMVSKRKAKYYNNNIESCNYRNDLFKCKFDNQSSKLVVNKLYDLQGICDTELTSRDLLSFCRQIAMGMDFLSSNKVVHRDLAARNILVARDKTLKIADFGLSRDVYEENQYKQKGNGKMPVKWMALESLERKIYTTKSDVWSFGVVVWEIVTLGGSPYPEVPPARLLRFLREGYRMQRPSNCSRELYSLMRWCWRASPGSRPSFSAVRARLDTLLARHSAELYLTLELDDRAPACVGATSRYLRIVKEKLGWSRNENYSPPPSPCRAVPVHNHYSSPPSGLHA